jgi:hypothetical protein
MSINENTKVKDWYTHTYNNDEIGERINSDITFNDVFNCLNRGKCIYELLKVDDSIVRERVFNALSDIMDCDYDYIYDQWITYA